MKILTGSAPAPLLGAGIACTMLLLMAGVAGAQTLTLAQSNATTLRGGTYASTNFSGDPVLETRASGDASYVRRGLLKFDTHTTIAEGVSIASARLTLTIAGGNSESRRLSAYSVTSPYDELTATWNARKASTRWTKTGGDLGMRYDTETVSNTPGSKVTFDVTALVQAVVRGDLGSRYTRFALIDEGASSRNSYKTIHSDDAANAAYRPILEVTLGTAPSSSTTSTLLRVLQYNTHHGGYGTDGRYDTNRLADWIVRMRPDVVLLNEIEKYTGWGNQNHPGLERSDAFRSPPRADDL